MKKLPFGNKLLLIPIIAAVISCCILLQGRIVTENANKYLSFVMEYSDIEALADAGNYTARDALGELYQMGLNAVLISDADEALAEKAAAVQSAGMRLAIISASGGGQDWIDAVNRVGADFEVFIAEGEQSADTLELLRRDNIALALVENAERTGAVEVSGIDAQSYTGGMIKTFKLLDGYRNKYGVLGYSGTEEIENIIFRAVTDRSMRIVWLTPFIDSDSGEVIHDLSEYGGVIGNLEGRVGAQGLIYNKNEVKFVLYPIQHTAPNNLLLFIICMGLGALAVILLKTLIKLPRMWDLILFLLWTLASVLALAVNAVLTQKAAAFAASVVLPCLAIYYLTIEAKRLLLMDNPPLGKTITAAAFTLAKTLGIALLGSVFVGAILSDSRFLLELDMFRGVKLSQILPLLYSVLIIYLSLYKGKKIVFPKLKKVYLVPILLLIFIALLVLLARSGDGVLSASVLEQRFRNWLETVLYARPRTKEMLIAFPALIVAVYLACRKKGAYLWAFLFVSGIGLVSVVNTFCHIRAPFAQSLIRTGLGAVIGLAVGILVIFIPEGISRVLKGKVFDDKSK